jgi:hypothetical protein
MAEPHQFIGQIGSDALGPAIQTGGQLSISGAFGRSSPTISQSATPFPTRGEIVRSRAEEQHMAAIRPVVGSNLSR